MNSEVLIAISDFQIKFMLVGLWSTVSNMAYLHHYVLYIQILLFNYLGLVIQEMYNVCKNQYFC